MSLLFLQKKSSILHYSNLFSNKKDQIYKFLFKILTKIYHIVEQEIV